MEVFIGIVGSVASEIGKSLVDPVKRHISYLIYYNRNITDLKDEREKLDDKIVEANQFVQDADKKFKVPIPGVPRWKEAADELNQKAFKFLENETTRASNRCLNGRCQNPWPRYYSSRNASKMTEDIKKKIQDSPAFGNVAYDAPPPNLGPRFKLEGVKDFESRLSVINDVWEALKNDELRMIGICGMGGVGKTTLVKALVKRVEAENLFGVVAMIEVSKKINLIIQHEIVEQLGLKIEERTLDTRARKLHEWVMKSEKSILLILDDVWDEVNFEAIGLPLRGDKMGYKIVLTSRNEDLCSQIGSQKNFRIHTLMKEEARDLFRKMTDDFVDGTLLNKASEIADECGGLPIAIVTLAKALKKKREYRWDDALLQLKTSNMKAITAMEKVYSRLELSFNLLESAEAKEIFLLCCLFPEDFNVAVEFLVSYGMGLGLFPNVQNVNQARNRVHGLIDELKESSLLLEGNSDYVKMHDLLRDVAISIASKPEHAYLVSCDKELKNWPAETDRYKDFTAISVFRREIHEHPVDLECPKLQLLQLACGDDSQRLPINFFEGMKELKVLSLKISSLTQPLDVLKKLRTLYLQFTCGDISSIGALTSLEILEIYTDSFEELPSEIGLLTNLRVLNLREVLSLEYIPSGVLARLSKLEELYVHQSFEKWESTEDGKTNASLKELDSHPITALDICVPNLSLLPKEPLIRNLKRFKIRVGGSVTYSTYHPAYKVSENELRIEGDRKDVIASGIISLLRNTELLSLWVGNLKNSLLDIVEVISRSQEISEFQNKDLVQLPYFNNLKHVKIEKSDGLKYVFPVSMTRGLKQLQTLSINVCSKIEGIFNGKEVKDDDFGFPNLKFLELRFLPNLIGFWVDMDNNAVVDQLRDDAATKPSSSLKISTNNQMPRGQELHGSSHCISGPVFLSQQLSNLQTLILDKCHSLQVVFSTSVAGQLKQLKTFHLGGCNKIEYVVGGKEEEIDNKGTTKIVLPMLKDLHLSHLPNLVAFYPDGHPSFHMPSLETLLVKRCPQMKTFCPTFPSPLLKMKNIDVLTSNLPIPSEEPTVKTFFPLSSIIPKITRRGRGQTSADSTVQRHNSNQTEEVSLTKGDYSSSHSDDRMETCALFPFKSMEGFGNLKKIELRDTSFNVIFSFDKWRADEAPFHALEKLSLVNISELTHIWFKFPPEITAFQNLKVLMVDQCPCLKYIFSPRVVKLLVKLEELSIEQCDLMESIVGEEEEEETRPGKIVFPQLSSLIIEGLKNLMSLCIDRSSTIECPLLERLRLRKCGRMRILLSYGSVITSSMEESSTNAIVEEKNKEEFAETCSAFSITSFEGTQNLITLRVTYCQSLEVIFSLEESQANGVLNNLESLELEYLPNLEHVWFKVPSEIKAFQNLMKLHVLNCDSLKYLFSPLVAKLLVKLEEVTIMECKMVEAIVKAEEEEDAISEKIVFPQLRFLQLAKLHNLKSFCTERLMVTIEFPVLEYLILWDCNQLRNFSYGSVITPKLKTLNRERQYEINNDLNATLQKIMDAINDLAEVETQRFNGCRLYLIWRMITEYEQDDDLTEDEKDEFAEDEQHDLTENEQDATSAPHLKCMKKVATGSNAASSYSDKIKETSTC